MIKKFDNIHFKMKILLNSVDPVIRIKLSI